MLKRIYNKLKNEFRREQIRRRYHEIYSKVSDYSMINPTLMADNLALYAGAAQLEGDVVECGVWRGGMSAAMALLQQPNRHFYLFDSFEGLPKPKEIDGQSAADWSAGKYPEIYWDNCTAEKRFANTIMNQTKQPFTLVKGWFENTLPDFVFERPIAVLRLDGDWYDSTLTCLQHLYPKMATGGVVIIDDYYAWDGCSRAVHDYLSATKSTARLHRSANGVAYFFKTEAAQG